MIRDKWLWSALLVSALAITGALVYANSQTHTFVCPITGEVLPCQQCCPFDQGK
jgi:hypothetical protein